MSEIKKNPLETEVSDETLDTVAGGRGMYAYYCCKCSYPAFRADHNGKYYCSKHWKETPEAQEEKKPSITIR